MSNKDLIQKILNEVEDEATRNKLIATLTSQGSSEPDKPNESLILKEIESLGYDSEKFMELKAGGDRFTMVMYFLVGCIFSTIGLFTLYVGISNGKIMDFILGGVFSFLGIGLLVSISKLKALVKKPD